MNTEHYGNCGGNVDVEHFKSLAGMTLMRLLSGAREPNTSAEQRLLTMANAVLELCDEVEGARREARMWRRRATKLNGGVEDPMWFTEV